MRVRGKDDAFVFNQACGFGLTLGVRSSFVGWEDARSDDPAPLGGGSPSLGGQGPPHAFCAPRLGHEAKEAASRGEEAAGRIAKGEGFGREGAAHSRFGSVGWPNSRW